MSEITPVEDPLARKIEAILRRYGLQHCTAMKNDLVREIRELLAEGKP